MTTKMRLRPGWGGTTASDVSPGSYVAASEFPGSRGGDARDDEASIIRLVAERSGERTYSFEQVLSEVLEG